MFRGERNNPSNEIGCKKGSKNWQFHIKQEKQCLIYSVIRDRTEILNYKGMKIKTFSSPFQ